MKFTTCVIGYMVKVSWWMKLCSWTNWPFEWDDLDGWNWISKSEIDHKGKTNVHMDEIFGINEINHTSKLHNKWHWYKNEP
jgi:hypothetical protein